MKACIVCSAGGHFLASYALKNFWEQLDHFWVTFRGADTGSLLEGERVYFAYSPTNRNIKNLMRNLFLAFKILTYERPDIIISTGAGVSVPFIYIGKLLGAKTIYIESLTRVDDLSLSGKLVYHIVDDMLVQWPELKEKYKKTKFVGQVI